MKKNIVMKTAVFLLCMTLVAGIYTFIVIPSVRKEEQKIYQEKLAAQTQQHTSVLTYNGETPLLENTIITEAISSCFETVKMPPECVTSDFVSSFEDICGLQIKYAICSGQQVSFGNFKEFLRDADGSERLKEFQIYSLVAGQAMPGRFADILIRYPNGDAAVVVPKIQIYDIQREPEAQETYLTDKNGHYTAVFAVNDQEHNDLVNAGREGLLDIRIYLDETQEASRKTYSPAVASGGI